MKFAITTSVALALAGFASAAASQPSPDQRSVQAIDADSDRRAAIERHIEAYRSGNLDRFVATFAPDAEVYANGLTARGRAQIRDLYRLNFAPGAPKIRIESIEIGERYIFVSAGFVLPDGSEMCCSISEYEIVDGQVTYLAASG